MVVMVQQPPQTTTATDDAKHAPPRRQHQQKQQQRRRQAILEHMQTDQRMFEAESYVRQFLKNDIVRNYLTLLKQFDDNSPKVSEEVSACVNERAVAIAVRITAAVRACASERESE